MTTSPTDTQTNTDTDFYSDSSGESNPVSSRSSSLGVGAKIYGIVALCLTLLAVVAGISIWQMGKIGAEIEAIAERDIPLTDGLTQVTIHQLEQAVQFERAFRFGEEMVTHPEIRKHFDKTAQKFQGLSAKVEKELKQVEEMAEKSGRDAHTAAEKAEFARVVTAIKKIEGEHKGFETIALQALKLIDGGKVEEAIKLEHEIVELEDKLDHELAGLLT